MDQTIRNEVLLGAALALFQASVSVAFMRWSLPRKLFYQVWGGSMLARFVFFGLTAFVIYRFTALNMAVVLLSLAAFTMVFMIIEVKVFLVPKK